MELVITGEQIKETAQIANIVWSEHYVSIIKKEQIDYMLEIFQSEKAIKKQLSEGYVYYILTDENENIGYIAYKINQNELFLSKIYLLKEYRGKGHAKNAVAFLVETAKENSCNKIQLTVNKNNTNSINAYEKLGFHKEYVQTIDIGKGFFMDDFVMEYDI